MKYALAFLLAVPVFAQAPADQPASGVQTAAAPAADSSSSDSQPWITGDIDFGQRFRTDVRGSMDTYRSAVNENAGTRLFGLNFTLKGNCCLFDRVDVRASNWGDPFNTVYVGVSKKGVYDFRYNFSDILYFNALPSFSDPGAPAGFDEQRDDVRRKNGSFALDLFPKSRVSPYLDYDRNVGTGTGIATWSQDITNEYPVAMLRRDSTNVYRGGVHVQLRRFHLTIEQGGTTFKDDDAAYAAGNIGAGDSTAKYFGQTLSLGSLQQAYGVRAHSMYSKGIVTANPFSWLDLSAQFLYSQPKTSVNYVDAGTGQLSQISAILFYYGQMDTVTGSANKPHVSGNAGFELRPFRRVRLVESWSTDRFHDAAYSTIGEAIYQTATSGASTTSSVLPDWESVNYNREEANLIVDATRTLTLRGGYRYEWGGATVTNSPLSQIGALESGTLSRQTALAALNFRPIRKVALNADYEKANTARAYFRTSLYNYDKLRARVRWQATDSLSLQWRYSLLNNTDPVPGLQYSLSSHDSAFAVNWAPRNGKHVNLMGEYDAASYGSTINYLLPPFFTPSLSMYNESAKLASGALELTAPKYAAKLSIGGSLAVTDGTRPFALPPAHDAAGASVRKTHILEHSLAVLRL